MKNDLLKIINNYGLIEQLKYFQSEVFELNEAILRYDEEEMDYFYTMNVEEIEFMKNHIKEEIADVLCMLRQFQYYYRFTDKQIDEIVKFKVERQLERMKGEKYGNKI